MATQAVPTAATAAPRAAPISLCGIYEFAQLSVSVLAGFVGFLDGIGEVLGFISGFVKAFGGFFRGGSVGTKVTRSMPFRAACALFSCICRLWVRRPFLPKDSAALARAEQSVSIFCFCWLRFPCSELDFSL